MSDRGLGDYCPSPEPVKRGKLTLPLVSGKYYVMVDEGKRTNERAFADSEWSENLLVGKYEANRITGVFEGIEDTTWLEDIPKPLKPEPRVMVVRRPMIQVDGVAYDDLDDLDEYICANLHIRNAEDRQMIREILNAVDEFEKGV